MTANETLYRVSQQEILFQIIHYLLLVSRNGLNYIAFKGAHKMDAIRFFYIFIF